MFAVPATPAAEAAAAGTGLPRLVLARYFYAFQADTRRPGAFAGIRHPDGRSALALHPWDGIGPWFSFERVQWHRDQLAAMRAAGVDLILPVYEPHAREAHALRGLGNLVQAMREMQADRTGGRERFPPRIALYLETGSFARLFSSPPDLKQEAVQRALHGVIREFFLQIPPEFRAVVQRPVTGRESPDCVVVALGSASVFKDLDRSFAQYCERRFREEFGLGIFWLAAADFQAKAAGLDAYLPPATGLRSGEAQEAPEGPRSALRVARLRPGYDNSALSESTPRIESRMNGRAYIEAWLEALRGGADWVILESWNGYADGTALAPTLEFGLQFSDLTRAGAGQFRARGDYAARILSATIPRRMAPRTLYQVEVIAQNSGLRGWGVANRVGLSYRWYQGERAVGDPAPLVLAGDVGPGEVRRLTLGVTAPTTGGEPLPDGDYELRLDMQLPATADAAAPLGSAGGRWLSEMGSPPYRVAVTVGGTSGARPFWLSSTLPGMIQSGESYNVTVRLRNDGDTVWRRDDGVGIGYRWRRVSAGGRGSSPGRDEVVPSEALRVPLPADLPPGAMTSVPLTVRAVGEGARPLPVWDVAQPWIYQIEWDLFDGKRWASEAAETPSPYSAARQTVQVLDQDDAMEVLGSGLPGEVTAGATVRTKLGLRNNGPNPWSPLRDRVVYHWFYPDGSEASFDNEGVRLPSEVRPGETVVVPEMGVRVPETLGPMFLVFDLKRGDRLVSAASNSRGTHLLVHPVNVTAGSEATAPRTAAAGMLPLNLAPWVNVDGISMDSNRADGDLDGEGRSLPGEALPPYVWRPGLGSPSLNISVYPSGLWLRPLAQRKPEEKVAFRFPDKREGQKNAIACSGQRIALPVGARRAIHMMATATRADASGTVTLVYSDGKTEERPLSVADWSAGLRHGEAEGPLPPVAFTCLHRHSREGDEPGVRASLYHYRLASDAGRSLAALILPQNPAIKVFAITLE